VATSSAMSALDAVFAGTGRGQHGQSDLELLAQIAASYDATFWVEGDVLHLSRIPRELTPSLELSWGRSLLDISPRMSTIGQVAGVAARFRLREIPLEFVVTVAW